MRRGGADDETVAFAHRLANAAGAAIRPYFRRRIDVTDKAGVSTPFDPVTVADREAELAMRAVIERERPNDGILGEEFGEKPSSNGRRWVLDPVDGTRAFITGRHEWASLIALEDNGSPILGLIDQPVLGERFIGVNGEARMLKGDESLRLQVRSCPNLAEAILCATHPSAYFTEEESRAFVRVERRVRMTRFGGDCYLIVALALGFVDLIVESTLKRWDIAALIPIVEGAGGLITNWQGRSCESGGQVLIAGDPRIHEAAMALLAG
ncbi:MAG: histidinol-phosphatase [Alphaproteobacteria bacterium]|nr:histidinol-phosphatase [Alphaproteobacteria bacterium]